MKNQAQRQSNHSPRWQKKNQHQKKNQKKKIQKKKNQTRQIDNQQQQQQQQQHQQQQLYNFSATTTATTPYPEPFPNDPNLKLPPNGFLRNVHPYEPSFRAALDTAYRGFACDDDPFAPLPDHDNDDKNVATPPLKHETMRKAIETMDQNHFFRYDVTQPFGHGTKCAKTYVTRCLLGEFGTTYKYLGLRMFSHPWNWNDSKNAAHNLSREVGEALQTVQQLNQTLIQRTKYHRNELETQSKRMLKGRAGFDIALVNRMEDSNDLKKEPTLGEGRCSVSWHADSSLEHYSTIAVYHTFFSNPSTPQLQSPSPSPSQPSSQSSQQQQYRRWSIALRVAHDSEGPNASKRGTDIDSSVVKETPPIAVSLPSGSAYYLLEDFNHHHQHAVLVNDSNCLDGNNNDDGHDDDDNNNNTKRRKQGNKTNSNEYHTQTTSNTQTSSNTPTTSSSPGIRYAFTHRLLREGHNVQFIMERCRTTCLQFHKKGPKLWRSEQLLLTEVESEWIRQFYVQGSGNQRNLWMWWEEPICTLLKYWSKLESRTKQVVDLLRFAAEERCGLSDVEQAKQQQQQQQQHSNEIPPRAKRKLREKRKKALAAVEDIFKRGEGTNITAEGDANIGASVQGKDVNQTMVVNRLYHPFAELLEERANMRRLWKKREDDHVFRRMSDEYKPMPVPFRFNQVIVGNGTEENHSNGTTAGAGANATMSKVDDDKCGSSSNGKEVGVSPLDGSPDGIASLARCIRQLGKAYISGNFKDLSVMIDVGVDNNTDLEHTASLSTKNLGTDNKETLKDKQDGDNGQKRSGPDDKPSSNLKEHAQSLTWRGWEEHKFGLEMQHPWSKLLLDGEKSIETRAYDLPKALIGKRIEILQSQPGEDGVSSLGNVIDCALTSSTSSSIVKRVGWCIFDRVIVYRYRAKFESDEGKHLVKKGSGYGWKDGQNTIIYGWVVAKCGHYENEGNGHVTDSPPMISVMIRRMRSLYELRQVAGTAHNNSNFSMLKNDGKHMKKKKRDRKKHKKRKRAESA